MIWPYIGIDFVHRNFTLLLIRFYVTRITTSRMAKSHNSTLASSQYRVQVLKII